MPEELSSDRKKFANGFLRQKDRENSNKNNVVSFEGHWLFCRVENDRGGFSRFGADTRRELRTVRRIKNLGLSSKTSKSARCVRKSQFRLQAADLKGNSQ